MDVKQRLISSMVISLGLTIISEGIVLMGIASLLHLSLFFIFPALVIFWLFQWIISPYVVGRGGYEVFPNDPQYGWLYNLVRKIAEESKIKPPRVFVIDAPYPNAFAYGNRLSGMRVGITLPLLNILNIDELTAVIAHEIGHIKHRDVEIGMTIGLIPTVLGYISTLLMNFGYLAIFLAADEIELLFAIAALAIGFVIFIVTFILQIFVLWFNRLRESYADYNSFLVLGEGSKALATALAKIEIYMQNIRIDPFTGIIVTAPRVKVEEKDPYLLVEQWLRTKVSVFKDILSTHPYPARRAQMIYRLIYGSDI
ncbi:zinc metalloprotease HtpX [Saccharolobus islandicus]|uniref:Protease HtpX homolog n=2 Tax=Saccharolobus islandicus TaxID=43080 RepID=M9U7S3_SACIS|nr:zinc metalloprotease HtpX [Sulfolobus islandicus]ADX84722.1 peptidase M48 Ste24p [Sulfolobus islandicus REY15A]AGJ62138.1 Zn-dependent protease with chaperone function [Sulfolobus islandicus LAL14/1]